MGSEMRTSTFSPCKPSSSILECTTSILPPISACQTRRILRLRDSCKPCNVRLLAEGMQITLSSLWIPECEFKSICACLKAYHGIMLSGGSRGFAAASLLQYPAISDASTAYTLRAPACSTAISGCQSVTHSRLPTCERQAASGKEQTLPADLSSKQGQDAAACPHVHDSLILEITEVPHDCSIVGTCRAQTLFCLSPAKKLCIRWRDEVSSTKAEQTSADHVLEHVLPA